MSASASARLAHRFSRLVAATATMTLAFAGVAVTQAPQASAASDVGGHITQSEVIARAWDWVNRRPYIKYDSSGNTSAPDAQGRPYRPDCSGAVSMAWHLARSLTTATLPGSSVLISSHPSSGTDLRPGDLLNVDNGPNGEHHAVLFDHWEADHVHFSVFSFGGGSDGNSPPQHETGRTFSGTVGGHPGSIYKAYRYSNVDQVPDLGVLEFYLSDSQTSSVATRPVISYGQSPMVPISGDWDGDGKDTVSTYDPTTGKFFISNDPVTGLAQYTFVYGNPGAVPLVGDWDGDGKDNIGVQMGNGFYMRTSPVTLATETTVSLAYGDAGMVPISGDWNGDGKDSVSAYDPTTGKFFISNDPVTGLAQYTFVYGNPGAVPLVGDWDGDGKDNIGVQMGNGFYMRTSPVTSATETTMSIGYGNGSGELPVIGDWDGDGKDSQGIAR